MNVQQTPMTVTHMLHAPIYLDHLNVRATVGMWGTELAVLVRTHVYLHLRCCEPETQETGNIYMLPYACSICSVMPCMMISAVLTLRFWRQMVDYT